MWQCLSSMYFRDDYLSGPKSILSSCFSKFCHVFKTAKMVDNGTSMTVITNTTLHRTDERNTGKLFAKYI